jgi:hypothetical protein
MLDDSAAIGWSVACGIFLFCCPDGMNQERYNSSWDTSLQQKNIELQLEAMKTHKDFVPFIFSALRVK